MSRKEYGYTNISLEPKLVAQLQEVYNENLKPLGLSYTHVSAIRYLVKFHEMTKQDWEEKRKEGEKG